MQTAASGTHLPTKPAPPFLLLLLLPGPAAARPIASTRNYTTKPLQCFF
jgi:hypothetical protein